MITDHYGRVKGFQNPYKTLAAGRMVMMPSTKVLPQRQVVQQHIDNIKSVLSHADIDHSLVETVEQSARQDKGLQQVFPKGLQQTVFFNQEIDHDICGIPKKLEDLLSEFYSTTRLVHHLQDIKNEEKTFAEDRNSILLSQELLRILGEYTKDHAQELSENPNNKMKLSHQEISKFADILINAIGLEGNRKISHAKAHQNLDETGYAVVLSGTYMGNRGLLLRKEGKDESFLQESQQAQYFAMPMNASDYVIDTRSMLSSETKEDIQSKHNTFPKKLYYNPEQKLSDDWMDVSKFQNILDYASRISIRRRQLEGQLEPTENFSTSHEKLGEPSSSTVYTASCYKNGCFAQTAKDSVEMLFKGPLGTKIWYDATHQEEVNKEVAKCFDPETKTYDETRLLIDDNRQK